MQAANSFQRADTRPLLVLQAAHLASADVQLIQMFLMYAASHVRADWGIGHHGTCDLLLRMHDDDRTIPGFLESPKVLGWIANAGDVVPPDRAPFTLVRPLQLENFVMLLLNAEALLIKPQAQPMRVRETPSPAIMSAPPATPVPTPIAARPAAATLMQVLPSAAALVVKTWQEAPDREQSSLKAFAEDASDPSRSTRYRLKRWPPAGALGSHRYYPRLASFITSRFLSMDELSTLSNVRRDDCQRFILLLRQQDLLDAKEGAPRPAKPKPKSSADETGSGQHPTPREPQAAGKSADAKPTTLFGRLRARLGIVNP